MNINKKIATQVFSKVKYFKNYKKIKGKFRNNGQFDKDGYPLRIFYNNSSGIRFEAYRSIGNTYEIYPKFSNQISLYSFFIYV